MKDCACIIAEKFDPPEEQQHHRMVYFNFCVCVNVEMSAQGTRCIIGRQGERTCLFPDYSPASLPLDWKRRMKYLCRRRLQVIQRWSILIEAGYD